MSPRKLVLLVDDNRADQVLVKTALSEIAPDVRLIAFDTGPRALEYLETAGHSPLQPIPDLILLDLNLPRMKGFEIVQIIRERLGLAHVPVIMLTSSQNPEDVQRSHELRANAFVVKSSSVDEFFFAIRSIKNFWLDVAVVPSPLQVKLRQLGTSRASSW